VTIHPSLQEAAPTATVSKEGAALARAILEGGMSTDDAISRTALHLLDGDRGEVVVCVLTNFVPEDTADWNPLGGRAWIREWVRPGSDRSRVPPPGSGPEAALTMPWMSRIARDRGVVSITDRDLLPSAASQDREELLRVGVRSLVASVCISGSVMFGSMSIASVDVGHWPDELIRDFELLNAALSSRLTLEQSRRSLAEAIDAGTETQLSFRQFFGAVGHELRTPLAAVLGYTEVLLDEAEHAPSGPLADAMLRDGPVVLRACEQVLGVVDTLLGAGRTLSSDDQRQQMVIAEAVADVVHWHRAPADSAGVQIHVDVDPTATVSGHQSGLRQVLAALLLNAITHHHPDGGEVHISTEPLLGESGQPMVRIIVRDDGPGLAADQIQHVFEPFVRYARPATKGSGLGLSIARTIAERDGGAVRGESKQGVGSSFWLELPVRSS
jgi:signal transduction histidine kinase